MNPANEVAVLDAGEGAPLPQFDGSNAVEQVFSNVLIWKTIGSYLNVGDLKACRLVNSRFHAMVMKETNFLERCLVSLKPDQITSNIFGSTREPWKNVLLKFGDPGEGSSGDFYEDELAWLYSLISNVESLSLRMEKGTDRGEFHYVLKPLLNAPKKLRTLAMEPIFLIDGSGENFDECEETLGNLEEFEILQPPAEWLNDIDKYILKRTNLDSVSCIKKMQKLRVLRSYNPRQPIAPFDEGYMLLAIQTYMRIKYLLTDLLASISEANRNTLKHVTLAESWFWLEERAEDMQKVIELYSFPSLESATFYLSAFHDCLVTEYILTLPMLKELEFSVRSALPMEVLNAIVQRSDCLRKLKIRSQGLQDTHWQFLNNTSIEEFQLELEEDSDNTGETLPHEALICLPLTVRRLFVRGRLPSNPIPALARLNPSLVTHLTFIDSGDEFTDDTMRFILGNFKMLRKLNVTNAKLVTDAGFERSSSGSLSGIKGLRTLILKECGSITDRTLEEIRFLELRYLDLSQNKNLTKTGYEGVLSNNPSSETLLMSCKSTYRRKFFMYASHPRLSSVAYRRLMTETPA